MLRKTLIFFKNHIPLYAEKAIYWICVSVDDYYNIADVKST